MQLHSYLAMKQRELFGLSQPLPPGMIYEPDFISLAEEASLLDEIKGLPLHEAQYKQYTAKRRIVSYGATYDFTNNELLPPGPIPPFLEGLRARISEWVEVPADKFTHALISEYNIGTQLGWHRDVPEFEVIVGV